MCHRFFYFNDAATTEIYTLSLRDALPIFGDVDRLQPPAHRHREHRAATGGRQQLVDEVVELGDAQQRHRQDRKSTRLNSSHANTSYAVFCLKKKYHHNLYNLLL